MYVCVCVCVCVLHVYGLASVESTKNTRTFQNFHNMTVIIIYVTMYKYIQTLLMFNTLMWGLLRLAQIINKYNILNDCFWQLYVNLCVNKFSCFEGSARQIYA